MKSKVKVVTENTTPMTLQTEQPKKPQHKLSTSLLELKEHVERISADCNTMLGILDNIHSASNVYDLTHRLKSLIGRERLFTKFLKRFKVLLDPLADITQTLEKGNG